MVRTWALIIGVLFGLNYGRAWVMSDDFQAWADERDAKWTCRVNMMLAEYHIAFGHWSKAESLFHYVLKRCPKSELEEKANFKLAAMLQAQGDYAGALAAYKEFVARYPRSSRARLAGRKIGNIEVQR